MFIHDEREGFFDGREQDLPVIDVNREFSLKCVVDKNTGPDTDFIVLSFPIGLECNWHSVPSESVDFSESLAHSLNDSSCNQVWLLL